MWNLSLMRHLHAHMNAKASFQFERTSFLFTVVLVRTEKRNGFHDHLTVSVAEQLPTHGSSLEISAMFGMNLLINNTLTPLCGLNPCFRLSSFFSPPPPPPPPPIKFSFSHRIKILDPCFGFIQYIRTPWQQF